MLLVWKRLISRWLAHFFAYIHYAAEQARLKAIIVRLSVLARVLARSASTKTMEATLLVIRAVHAWTAPVRELSRLNIAQEKIVPLRI